MNRYYANHITKGQIILKGHLISSNSPKKQTKEFVFTTMTNFRENSRTPKSPFEIIWPLLIRPPPTRFSDLPTGLVFSVLLMQRWMMIHTRLGLGWALHFFSGLDFGTSQTKQLYLFRYLPHKLSHCIIIIKNVLIVVWVSFIFLTLYIQEGWFGVEEIWR